MAILFNIFIPSLRISRVKIYGIFYANNWVPFLESRNEFENSKDLCDIISSRLEKLI